MSARNTITPDPPAAAPDRETLERLSNLDTGGRPVLSVYVDLDPLRFPTPGSRDTQVGSLLDRVTREAGGGDAARLRVWLDANPEVRRGARGLALFSCVGAGLLEVVPLAAPVEPLAVVDTIPWLEPLAALATPGGWGVAVVDRRSARLLRGGPGGLSGFAAFDDDLHRRHAQGGWSQARFQRGIEEQVAWHVSAVSERLLRAHRRRPFEHLVIVCGDELRPVIRERLHGALSEVLAGFVAADLGHASVERIAAAVAAPIDRVERERERALAERVDEALGTGGTAAAGIDEVLATLEQERVATLLVGEGSALAAWRCPRCERLSGGEGGRCAVDGAQLAAVDGVEHAVEAAAAQSGQVVVIRHEREWLRGRGEIAALLRW